MASKARISDVHRLLSQYPIAKAILLKNPNADDTAHIYVAYKWYVVDTQYIKELHNAVRKALKQLLDMQVELWRDETLTYPEHAERVMRDACVIYRAS